MGYYTRYRLKWEPNDPAVATHLIVQQHKNHDFCYGISPDGSPSEDTTWYEHEADVKELSKSFPNLTFTLTGEGEQAGDLWAMRFRNGKMERAKTSISIKFKDGTEIKVGG